MLFYPYFTDRSTEAQKEPVFRVPGLVLHGLRDHGSIVSQGDILVSGRHSCQGAFLSLQWGLKTGTLRDTVLFFLSLQAPH